MVWRRPGDKPLSEPIRVDLPTHICVTWPQWDIHVVLILFPRLEIRKRVGWNDKILSRHWLYCDEWVFCWHWGEKGSHGDYFVVPGCTGGGLHDHLQCHQGLQIRHHDCLSFSVDVLHDDVIKWKRFPRYWPFVRGIHRWPVNSPQRPVTRNFDVFCDLRLNKRLSKQSMHRWFETPSRSVCRHCNGRWKSVLI